MFEKLTEPYTFAKVGLTFTAVSLIIAIYFLLTKNIEENYIIISGLFSTSLVLFMQSIAGFILMYFMRKNTKKD